MDPSAASRRLCSNCGTNATPMWRRSSTGATVCNACGIFLNGSSRRRSRAKKHPKPRPAPEQFFPGQGSYQQSYSVHCDRYPQQPQPIQITQCPYPYPYPCPQDPCPQGVSTEMPMNDVVLEGLCYNCGTTSTPLWRRDDDDNPICNACGLFFKSHNYHRPRVIWSTIIKRRNRVVPVEHKHDSQPVLNTSPVSRLSEREYHSNWISHENSPSVSPTTTDSFASHGYGPIEPQSHNTGYPPWQTHTIPLDSEDRWTGNERIDENIPGVKDIHCQPVRLPSIKFLLG